MTQLMGSWHVLARDEDMYAVDDTVPLGNHSLFGCNDALNLVRKSTYFGRRMINGNPMDKKQTVVLTSMVLVWQQNQLAGTCEA